MNKHTMIRTIAIVGGMVAMTVSTIINQKKISKIYETTYGTNNDDSDRKKES